ncbi:excisionase family DNA-binding protein [Mycolicibacterium holsaticum]|uniref:excisionase family DNA-binding protein n=1 Tax=Mycolicibacterium holsaticum TaxID=152142 RepID=UPI001C7CF648|nr:excisionase family DNA-binding protein [Mycolicibacterium holsaticum]MDA4108156.1 DNA-binding protein [Mycolicibacterium holsaticum DSM 44478 = JCM 12374]QZA14434.1 excisionase family DNA-binding protein [Mycolicibacterium holsaticum DSM 44478 = JCM 12374]UNC08116.1 excisionase family DNA-binding protein [Mycolicibacterium holsaticum DSM 44478 = JCM 12374]
MPARPITPDFESLQHAAARTGFSVFTFRALVSSGKLPAYRLSDKPGSAIRVKRADVDALMKPLIPEAVYAD